MCITVQKRHSQMSRTAHHSTETSLPDVMNRLLDGADEGHVSALTILDLSAAFDALDIIAFTSHGCMTCTAYLARFSGAFHRTGVTEFRL